jgi:exonuclease III
MSQGSASGDSGSGGSAGAEGRSDDSRGAAVIERAIVCVWTRAGGVSTAAMWVRIEEVTPPRLRHAVIRVRNVHQPDGQRRFDIVVERRRLDEVCDVWRDVARLESWRVRPHTPYWVRSANLAVSSLRLAARQQHEQRRLHAVEAWVRRRFLVFATWNVNHIGRKKADVEAKLLAVPGGVQVVALQETMRVSGDWALRIAGYQCIERRAGAAYGARGIALCVRHGLQITEVGRGSDYCIFGRVTGFGVDAAGRQRSAIFGSVYIPPGGLGTAAIRASVHASLAAIRSKFVDEVVICMGDFNMTTPQCAKWAARVRAGSATGMAVDMGCGNMTSRFSKKLVSVPLAPGMFGPVRCVPKLVMGRDIDHILVSAPHGDLVTAVQVDRSFIISDHWAVRGKLCISSLGATEAPNDGAAQGVVTERWRFTRSRPLGAAAGQAVADGGEPSPREAVRGDSRWRGENPFSPLEVYGIDDVIPKEIERQVVNAAATHFTVVSRAVAKDAGWMTKQQKPGQGNLWQAKAVIRTAQETRSDAFRAWRKACKAAGISQHDVVNGGMDDQADANGGAVGVASTGSLQRRLGAVVTAWAVFKKASKAAKDLRRKHARLAWIQFVESRVVKLANEPGRQWATIKSLMGRGRGGALTTPTAMWDEDDKTVVNVAVEDVCAGWQTYFERNCRGGDDPKYRTPEYWRQFQDRPVIGQRLDGIPEANERLKWTEVCSQLRGMAAAKAPGPDGLPVWWLQLVVDGTSADRDPDRPTSDMGQCLFGLLQFMWTHGVIPEEWEMAEVVPIFKKGDAMDRTNYRPISLMQVALKVVCGVVKSRFEMVVDGVLPRSQGGFRRREECVAQVTALHDAIWRRKAKGLTTVVAFWDMKKAYDTVPHQGLLMKLRRFGFSGRFMAFVEALYDHPKLKVRVAEGVWTHVIDLLAGVRQGDIPSPAFFNFFILDLSETLATVPNPCVIPGVDEPLVEVLFADDLATVADGPVALRAQIDVIERWCEENDMAMNVPKCAMLVVAPTAAKGAAMKAELAAANLTVHGSALAVCESVTYLGLSLHESWELEVMAADRVRVGKALVSSIRAFLSCTTIPLATRALVIRTVVIPTMLYGCELWGCLSRAQPVQQAVNAAMRTALHCHGGVSVAAISSELGINPVFATVVGRRMRLRAKATSLRTWIATLTQQEWGQCWSRRCVTMAKKHGVWPALQAALEPPAVDCKGVYKEVVSTLTERCYSDGSSWMESRSGKSFRDADMAKTSLASPDLPWVCGLGNQLTLLARSRCGGVAFTCRAWAAGHDRAVLGGLNSCPFCRGMPDAVVEWETATHVWVRCVRWRALRDKYGISALIQWCREFGPDAVSDDGIATLLQGGSVQDTAVKHWAVGKSPTTWGVIVSVQGNSDVEGIDIKHGSAQAALFLAEVQQQRMMTIREWSRLKPG